MTARMSHVTAVQCLVLSFDQGHGRQSTDLTALMLPPIGVNDSEAGSGVPLPANRSRV